MTKGKYIRTEELRKKMSEAGKGKKSWNKDKTGVYSEETLQKMRDAKKNMSDETRRKIGNASRNRYFSPKSRKKMSLAHMNPSDKTRKKMSESQKNRKHTSDTLQQMRETAIKRIEEQFFNGLSMMPCIGNQETQILDILEKSFGYKIIRQYKVYGYFLDGYIPELNLAIEIDEQFHENQVERDSIREDNIKQELGCEFFRIKVPDKYSNKAFIIPQIPSQYIPVTPTQQMPEHSATFLCIAFVMVSILFIFI